MNILNSSFFNVHIDTQEVIAFTAMSIKKHYDKKHISKFFSSDDKIILHLHKRYTISLIKRLEKKFTQQYADHFTVLKQVDCLVYKLDLSQSWEIHLIISIVYLESVSKNDDFFDRHSDKSDLIIIEQNDINENDSVSSYQIEWLLDKRVTIVRNKIKIEYLVRWLDYRLKNDVWYNIKNLNKAKKLIADYEKMISHSNSSSNFMSQFNLMSQLIIQDWDRLSDKKNNQTKITFDSAELNRTTSKY